jgi:hypothetical protein
MIYRYMTRTDIIHAVNKLAKFSRRPGRNHFEALLYTLRYLRDNSYLGIKFYSNFDDTPLIKMLKAQQLEQNHPFFGFSDSSWNDNVDAGRSTGCFIITYMGGVVDHSSNLPDPVALSSAEAEYNERMLLCEIDNIEESTMQPRTIYFDSKSTIAMGESYKDTKHTRHILRHYHYVREGINSNRFKMLWITTEFQIVDMGTKQTPGPRHKFLVELIHVKVNDESITKP